MLPHQIQKFWRTNSQPVNFFCSLGRQMTLYFSSMHFFQHNYISQSKANISIFSILNFHMQQMDTKTFVIDNLLDSLRTSLKLFALLNQIEKWHWLMIVSELISFAAYIISIVIFKSYFDIPFIESWKFIWRVLVITIIACLPFYILRVVRAIFKPRIQEKLMEGTRHE